MFAQVHVPRAGGLATIPVPIVTVYDTAGSSTHTFDPASVSCDVIVTGGGQGGNRSSSANYSGQGGVAGSTVMKSFDIVAASASVVVGASGVGSTANNNNTYGTPGGTSSFSDGTNILTATGGQATATPAPVGGDLNIAGGGETMQDSHPVDSLSGGGASFWGGGLADTSNYGDCAFGAGGQSAESGNADQANGEGGVVIVVEWAA